MIYMGLNATQHKKYVALLTSPHWIKVTVQVLDMNHNYLSDLSDRLLDGQVSFDATSDILRSLDMDILDPKRALHFDSNSPADGSMFADRMIRIVYSVAPPTRSVWYDCVIFCGPIVSMNRNGAVISVQCQGKEALAQGTSWFTKTFKKGYNKVRAMKTVLADFIGELSSKTSIPALAAKFPRNSAIGLETYPWKWLKTNASGMSRQLFYDGRGIATMRKYPTKTSFTYTESVLKSQPNVAFKLDGLANAVEVIGAKPKKKKKQIKVRVVAPRAHALSPWSLGRSGGPRYIPKIINDSSIKTATGARRLALKTLNASLIEGIDVSFDALPIPHLEEEDLVGLNTRLYSTTFRLKKMTIPLTAQGSSSVGYLKNVSPNKRAVRYRRA